MRKSASELIEQLNTTDEHERIEAKRFKRGFRVLAANPGRKPENPERTTIDPVRSPTAAGPTRSVKLRNRSKSRRSWSERRRGWVTKPSERTYASW